MAKKSTKKTSQVEDIRAKCERCKFEGEECPMCPDDAPYPEGDPNSPRRHPGFF